METWSRQWFCKSLFYTKGRTSKIGGEMVMTGWDWFGLITFFVILMLLFFAAFGGSNITDESIEDYMNRLMQKDNKEGK